MRKGKEEDKRTIYSDLPQLYKELKTIKYLHNFFILYDNSIDTNYKLISPESSIKIISENFGNVIWPSIKSKRIIFTLDNLGKPQSTQKFKDQHSRRICKLKFCMEMEL